MKFLSSFACILFLALHFQISAQSFGKKHILSTGGFLELTDFTTSDIDNDGDVDVLATDYNKNYISFFENLGNGEFAFVDSIPSRWEQTQIEVVDIDYDGDKDILLGLWGVAIGLKLNLGNMEFEQYSFVTTNIHELKDISTALIDNDSLPDVIFSATTSNQLGYCKNLGNGEFSDQIILFSGAELANYQIIDFDLDGDNDILCTEYETNKTSWFENDGTGQFIDQHIIYFDFFRSRSTTAHAFDYDNDNDNDVVIGFAEDSLWLFENNGQNQFQNMININNNNNALELSSFNYNNDAFLDLVYLHGEYNGNDFSKMKVLLNNYGNDTMFLKKYVTLPEIHFANSYELVNIYDSEDVEIVVCTGLYNPTITWLKKDSIRTYVLGDYVSSKTPNIRSIDLADINGDQHKDLFVYCSRTYNALFQNTGSGPQDTITKLKKISEYHNDQFFYDFDKDGYDDILQYVMRYYPSSQNFIYGKNNGDFTFDTVHRFAPHHEYRTKVLNDYNNNGYVNIVEVFDNKVFIYDCMPSFDIILKDSFEMESYMYWDALLTDIDLDDCNDLIIPRSYNNIKIHFYTGENHNCFSKHNVMPGEYLFQKLAPAYINNDEYIDFYFINSSDEDGWLENLGGQYFAKRDIQVDYDYWYMYPIDIDNDGIDEMILYRENEFKILANIANGGEIIETYNYGDIEDAIVFDIDYDGDLDFITYSEDNQECAWLENNLINTSVHSPKTDQVVFYPNPTSKTLNFKTNSEISLLTITNLMGQTILQFSNPDNTVDISSIQNGLYIVSFISNGKAQNQKVIIRR